MPTIPWLFAVFVAYFCGILTEYGLRKRRERRQREAWERAQMRRARLDIRRELAKRQALAEEGPSDG